MELLATLYWSSQTGGTAQRLRSDGRGYHRARLVAGRLTGTTTTWKAPDGAR